MFHKRNPKRLTISLIIFLFIIFIGFITMKKPEYVYKNNPNDMVETILSLEDEMTPEEAFDIIQANDPNFVFIDIRNRYDFIKGHIENAKNIPLTRLIEKNTLKTFDKYANDSVCMVLYGNDQTGANGPWMILKQLGYSNVKVLLGGYDFYSKNPDDTEEIPDVPEYYVEDPKYDFAEIAAETASSAPAGDQGAKPPVPVTPVRKKKKQVISGGC
jgi:rhodanese-related sulfurtransferase